MSHISLYLLDLIVVLTLKYHNLVVVASAKIESHTWHLTLSDMGATYTLTWSKLV